MDLNNIICLLRFGVKQKKQLQMILYELSCILLQTCMLQNICNNRQKPYHLILEKEKTIVARNYQFFLSLAFWQLLTFAVSFWLLESANLGPVVQSIIGLMSSLRGQLIKCFSAL